MATFKSAGFLPETFGLIGVILLAAWGGGAAPASSPAVRQRYQACRIRSSQRQARGLGQRKR